MATEHLPAAAGPGRDGGAEAGADDAAALVARLGGALDELARTVDELGEGLAPALAAAAERDPAVLVRAQGLDAVAQSLHGLAAFLAEVGRHRVGREPLPLASLAGGLPLQALADRMSGRPGRDRAEDDVFF